MSRQVKVTVLVEVDGVPLDGFPMVRRLTLDQLQQFAYQQATGLSNVVIPVDKIANVKAILVRADQAIKVHLDSDGGIELSQNGLLLVLDATINAGAGVANAKADNTSGSTANIEGFGGGT